jgi:hypothetical protein
MPDSSNVKKIYKWPPLTTRPKGRPKPPKEEVKRLMKKKKRGT